MSRILIIGTGITGTAAAPALQKTGRAATVFETYPGGAQGRQGPERRASQTDESLARLPDWHLPLPA